MLVYRFEAVNNPNKGIYQGAGPGREASRYELGDGDPYVKFHPNPANDPGLGEWWRKNGSRRYFFGFSSMEQLEQWFPVDKHYIIENYNAENPTSKIHLVVYEMHHSDVQCTERQVVFLKENAINKWVEKTFDKSPITTFLYSHL